MKKGKHATLPEDQMRQLLIRNGLNPNPVVRDSQVGALKKMAKAGKAKSDGLDIIDVSIAAWALGLFD